MNMRFRWLPWKYMLKTIARRHGFLDPIALLSQLQRFVQPSEISEPVELLRAGAVMHARGLINNRVIQHNLDWVWPYWIERQFDPRDISFIPRAFSITHINLSHRNWTAVGLPDYPDLPIVDPRGLLTPFLDGWSIDTWLVSKDGDMLLPSRVKQCSQNLCCKPPLSVVTESVLDDLIIHNQVAVVLDEETPVCRLEIEAKSSREAWIALVLRPYNPEGVSFVYHLDLQGERRQWLIDKSQVVKFDRSADRHHVANYQQGDVHIHLNELSEQLEGECKLGMLTAAAMFKLDPQSGSGKVTVTIPLKAKPAARLVKENSWQHHLQDCCLLQHSNEQYQSLYEIALHTMLLHSSEDVYPGPYTYKRFWFRDAVFIVHALLCAGLTKRAEQAIDKFPSRQSLSGYFHSQEGEWDSNGEVLWVLLRFCQLTNQKPKASWLLMIRKGADWIINKRLPANGDDIHAGLLPAGFSAEHLGPSNYYYWDNFWGIAGLQAASALFALAGDLALSETYQRAANDFNKSVQRSLFAAERLLGTPAIPAAPTRRLDAGAIGSLAHGYPTQLVAAQDKGLLATVDYLLANCCVDDGFFQDMTHSGINPYLTLHIAQVLMRAGDARFDALINKVAALASPTGQWPEAIHPHTEGGCMGDGQHVWAAAEWIMVMRNSFVREEENCLVIGSGISRQSLSGGKTLKFGPAPTSFGVLQLTVEPSEDVALQHTNQYIIRWQASWYKEAHDIEVRVPNSILKKPNHGENWAIVEYAT